MAVIMNAGFSGSYQPGEVAFLLRPLQLETTSLQERERLIQSGQCHYSEMIGPEDAPTRERLRLFRRALAVNEDQFANDIAKLADGIVSSVIGDEVTLVSIARAGTPVGVLLLYRLRQIAPHLRVAHYSISVIRDRGVDTVALENILKWHQPESLRFVDGWTGKGTIASELRRSLARWTQGPRGLNSGLWVPLDVSGVAAGAASNRDYLIPSSLLGGTISGLVSRSVLPRTRINQPDFHGCVLLGHLRRYDLSRWFIDHMTKKVSIIPPGSAGDGLFGSDLARQNAASQCLRVMLDRYRLSDVNRIKLGIGETVRVLLRRLPKVVLMNNAINEDDAGLIEELAAARGVPVRREEDLFFSAVAVIENADSTTTTQ
jgi:hypothetical protein